MIVTGASGFLGRPLTAALSSKFAVTAIVRSSGTAFPKSVAVACYSDLSDLADPAELQGCDILVHCAARAHILNDRSSDPLEEFRTVNTRSTEALARAAVQAGVRRFVFISSIKVNGEATTPGAPFKASDSPAPVDPYGISKSEAEQAVKRATENSATEFIIIRPPLVYGPSVKGNLRWLDRLARLPIAIPLGRIENRRSLISVDNLISLIELAMTHPAAAGETFLASDGVDLSTSQLVAMIQEAHRGASWLLPAPVRIIQMAFTALGKKGAYDRLFGSLQVDPGHAQERLGWRPVETPAVGIAKAFGQTG